MMKYLLCLSSLFMLTVANAQSPVRSNASENTGFSTSTAVKINPASIFLGKLSLLGEYNFKPKKSLTLGIGIPLESTLKITIDDEKREFKLKTFSVMGGYRMYLGKKDMTGFYFEPYLKYMKNDLETGVDGEIETDIGTKEPTTFRLSSNYSGFGLGAQLGVQFMIAKVVVFDLFILGPEANMSNHKLSMKDLSTTIANDLAWASIDEDEAKNEIKKNVEDLPVLGPMIAKKMVITVDKTNKTISSEYSGFLPGFRFGLSVGIRF